MLYAKALIFWFAMLVVIVVLGGLRDAFLRPALGEQRAHQLGTLAACVAVLLLIVAFARWTALTARDALHVGAFWLALALGFEFGVFHYLRGVPWSRLLHDYDLLRGRLLLLLWATVLLGPWVVVRLSRAS